MNKKWRIVITPEASLEIRGIYDYIASVLLVPKTAKKQVAKIIKALESLSEMPHRNPLYDKKPWKSRGLRKLVIDNFLAFYLTNDKTSEVVVLRIFYGGRNIEELL